MKYLFEEAISQLEESKASYFIAPKPLRFIIDAQLPKKLSDFLNQKGFDSIHTLELPDKNKTTDTYIIKYTDADNRILISKDDDFLQSFLISKKPEKLILIKTGNIRNTELLEIFDAGLLLITSLIRKHALLEITQNEIIVHN